MLSSHMQYVLCKYNFNVVFFQLKITLSVVFAFSVTSRKILYSLPFPTYIKTKHSIK